MSSTHPTKTAHARREHPAPEGADADAPSGNGAHGSNKIRPDFRADDIPSRQTSEAPAPQRGGSGTLAATTTAAGAALPPPSAFLVRRVAEAADGVRGKDVWCTALPEPDDKLDYRVHIHETQDEAQAAKDADPALQIFGPFHTAPGKGPEFDSTPILSVVLTLANGTITIDPKKYDSLFWTVSAVDKFLSPYYAANESLERAQSVKSQFDQEGKVCTAHGPTTEPDVKSLSDVVVAHVQATQEGGGKSALTFFTLK